jgi:hypothetical protein
MRCDRAREFSLNDNDFLFLGSEENVIQIRSCLACDGRFILSW